MATVMEVNPAVTIVNYVFGSFMVFMFVFFVAAIYKHRDKL